MSWAFVAGVLVLATAGPASLASGTQGSSAPQKPVRDRREVRAGTAQIAGRVAAADTGAPLRDTEITLSSSTLPDRRVTRTDASGRYRFADLAGGRYWLRASKPGYCALRHGATDPLDSGRPVDLRDNDTRADLDFKLPRAAVISGRVQDEYGEPVLDVEVRAMRYQMLQGQRRLTLAARVRLTDDLGAFRLFGLLPGTYIVAATPHWRDPSPGADGSDETYAPTYFPGTSDLTQARAVKVQMGEEVSGIDFGLIALRTARVTGSVLDSTGAATSGAQVSAVRRERGNVFVTVAEARTRPDGSFELSRLPPGVYTVQAWVRGAAPDRESEFGAVAVHVAEAAVNGVLVRTDRGGTVRGYIVLRADPAIRGSRFKPSLVEISARPADEDVRLTTGRASTARVGADWTFELRALSGARLIRVSGVPSPWALDGIYLDGRDVTDDPVTFKAGSPIRNLEVVLTTRTTEVAGTVDLPEAGRARQATVLVFPAEGSDWDPQSRRVQIRRPDAQGRFRIRGLPPGDYVAVAVPFVWQGEWTDADFITRARAAGTRFTLAPAGAQTLQLKISAVEP
jgi:protocatechuate 3,4-dioxygenase beta subunit